MAKVSERGLEGVVPFRFECHRCGHCCSGGEGHVWLEDGECERLAAALGLGVQTFLDRHVRRVPDPRDGRLRFALREAGNEGGRCTLLEGRNTCRAYTSRPRHCAEFPFWEPVLREPAAFEAARSTCPGIAVVVPEPARARAHARLAALFQSLGPPRAEGGCCVELRADELFATGLEADYAVEHARSAGGCRLGPGAPAACRATDGEAALSAVRRIERESSYPAAYGRLDELLGARAHAAREGAE